MTETAHFFRPDLRSSYVLVHLSFDAVRGPIRVECQLWRTYIDVLKRVLSGLLLDGLVECLSVRYSTPKFGGVKPHQTVCRHLLVEAPKVVVLNTFQRDLNSNCIDEDSDHGTGEPTF